MSIYKTEQEVLEEVVTVWAVPVRNPQPDQRPFTLEVHREYGQPWQEGAAKIHSTTVKIVVPAGIDLVQAALSTLEEKKEDLRAETYKKLQELDEQISRLQLLTHQPTQEGGELV